MLILSVIHVFDLPTGLVVRSSTDNTVTKLLHKMTVSSIALSQTGPISERQLALLDYNRDLYAVTVKDNKPKFVKLGEKIPLVVMKLIYKGHFHIFICFVGSQVLSVAWSAETELLVGIRANSAVAWCCPRAATQPDWQALTTISKEIK